MNNTIVISDLDGTLLTTQKEIPIQTKKWIENWISKGNKFIVATGRHYINTKDYFSDFEFKPILITSNGAMLNDNLLFKNKDVNIYNIGAMVALADHYDCHISAFDLSGWSVYGINNMVKEHDFKHILLTKEKFLLIRPFKILFNGEPKYLEKIQNTILQKHPEYHVFLSERCLLEVQRKGINKSCAIRKYIELSHCDNCETIAFGDGMNDVEMLNDSTVGVAMKNSMPTLKEQLKGTFETSVDNDKEGVRQYLEAYFR